MQCTLLTKDEVCDIPLEIFKKYGTNAAVTDFTLLLGIEVSSDHTSDSLYYKDSKFTDTRAADYWTKTKEGDKIIAISSYSFGYYSSKKVNNLFLGIRPVLNYSDIKDNVTDTLISDKKVLEVEYGEYPQTVCEEKVNAELEKLFREGNLVKTGKRYTINSSNISNFFQTISEYSYKGRKYIRFVADRNDIRTRLSNKKYIEYGKPYWIEVEPITWMIDEDIAVSKRLLITGILFDINYSGVFEDTQMFDYLNNYFVKEIKAEKKKKERNRFDDLEIENMSLEELQELRFKIEKELKRKVKIIRKGGVI